MRKSKHPEHPLVVVRDENKLTQPALAEMIGVTDKYLSLIENGNKPVSRKLAEKIHNHDDLKKRKYNIDWLMGKSRYKTDDEALAHALKSYDNPLEFEKDWHRKGGGAHPANNIIVTEARIAVALEKLNENGWRIAVDMIESLCNIPDFQNRAKGESNDES